MSDNVQAYYCVTCDYHIAHLQHLAEHLTDTEFHIITEEPNSDFEETNG